MEKMGKATKKRFLAQRNRFRDIYRISPTHFQRAWKFHIRSQQNEMIRRAKSLDAPMSLAILDRLFLLLEHVGPEAKRLVINDTVTELQGFCSSCFVTTIVQEYDLTRKDV